MYQPSRISEQQTVSTPRTLSKYGKVSIAVLTVSVFGWYAYRSATLSSVGSLTEALFSNDEINAVKVDTACGAAAKKLASLYDRYTDQHKRYKTLTTVLLNKPPLNTNNFSAEKFVITFENIYEKPISDEALRERGETVKRLTKTCAIGGLDINLFNSVPAELTNEISSFEGYLHVLTEANEKVELIVKYSKGELPETLGGDLMRRAAEKLFREATRAY